MKEPIALEIIDFKMINKETDNKDSEEDNGQMVCEDGVCKI